MIVKIKNNSNETKTWCGQSINSGSYYEIQSVEYQIWSSDPTLLVDIANAVAIVNDGTSDITNVNSAIDYLKGNSTQTVSITSQIPFAEPTHRTKFNATADTVVVVPGEESFIDFKILCTSAAAWGGCIIYKNAEFGDHVTAEVYDLDGIIPEAYRAATCEAWPSVAKYLVRAWVNPIAGQLSVDSRPLSAKISQGLYLRVTYHATEEGIDRKVAVNYFLTKKL